MKTELITINNNKKTCASVGFPEWMNGKRVKLEYSKKDNTVFFYPAEDGFLLKQVDKKRGGRAFTNVTPKIWLRGLSEGRYEMQAEISKTGEAMVKLPEPLPVHSRSRNKGYKSAKSVSPDRKKRFTPAQGELQLEQPKTGQNIKLAVAFVNEFVLQNGCEVVVTNNQVSLVKKIA